MRDAAAGIRLVAAAVTPAPSGEGAGAPSVAMDTENGLGQLKLWQSHHIGVPAAVDRLSARLVEVSAGTVTMTMPIHDELRLPDGRASASSVGMLADVGLAAAVLTRMPPGVMVTTVSTSLDHLAPAPQDGSLIAVCRAGPCGESDMHHAVGEIRDANGMLHARATGWLLLGNAPVAAQAAPPFPQEPRGSHVLDLLQASEETEADHVAVRFLVRPSLSNLMGVLHGGIGAIACEALAEMALGPGSRLLNSSFAYLRPVREGTIATVTTEMVRRGRRTAVLRARLLTGTGATSLQVCVVAEVTPPCEQSKGARPGWSSD